MLTVPEQNRERGGSTASVEGTTGTGGGNGGGSARSSQHDLLEMLLRQGRSELTSATKTVPASVSDLLRRLSNESDLPRCPSLRALSAHHSVHSTVQSSVKEREE